MDNELEVIRDEMEQTRANLADKLGALENQVRETVSDATEAVSSTVEGVKDVVSTVSDTVESVTDTFNVSKQFEQNPWMALGVAVAAGFVAAQLFGGSQPAPIVLPPQPAPPPTPLPDLQVQPQACELTQQQPSSQQKPAAQQTDFTSFLPSLESMLPDMGEVMNTMVTGVGGLAVGSMMGVVRELAVNGLPPEWKGEITKLVDQVTEQLGGKPLQPMRREQSNGEQPRQQPRRAEGVPFDPQKKEPPRQEAISPAGEQSANAGSRSTGGARSQTAL